MPTQQENGKTSSPEFWKDKTILITGAGSLGNELVDQLLKLPIHAVRVLDVSENALYELLQRFGHNEKLRMLQGDVRNKDRLRLALNGVDYVVHTAALKSVDIASFNPLETIDVNLGGTIVIIQECLRSEVEKVVTLSSDKSIISSPGADVYHATKFLVEKVTLWANSISDTTKFSCIRPANFVPSKMSFTDTWFRAYTDGLPLVVNSPKMERYFIDIRKAAKLTLRALETSRGGEIWVPKCESYNILNLAQRLNYPYTITKPRLGDREREELMDKSEEARAEDVGDMWVLRG